MSRRLRPRALRPAPRYFEALEHRLLLTQVLFDVPIIFGTSIYPTGLTSADFTRDGKSDLAVTSGGVLSILRGNGDGTFDVQADYPAESFAWMSAAGDFNGDGAPDLAVANIAAHTFSIFLNKGDGTFADKVDYATGKAPNGLSTGDIDGDGKTDLALVNRDDNTLGLFFGKGDGTFASQVLHPTGPGPRWSTIADLDADGKPDVAVVSSGDNTLNVLLNRGGSLSAKVDYATGQTPLAVVAADLDGDGIIDLAVANRMAKSVGVFRGTGGGAFAPMAGYAAGDGPYSLTASDLNGDGKVDLAVSNALDSGLAVLLNAGDGTFPTARHYEAEGTSTAVSTADFNRDGKPDVAMTSLNSVGVTVLLNHGDGTYPAPLLSPALRMNAVEQLDVNKDGRLDLVYVSTGTFAVLLNQADGTYVAKTGWTGGAEANSVAMADLNADGKLDAAFTNAASQNVSVVFGNGDGTFGAGHSGSYQHYDLGRTPRFVRMADMNGDGRPDLIVQYATASVISILLNQGNGTFGATVDYTSGVPGSYAQPLITDLNADGRPDVVVTNQAANTISLLLNSGTGTLLPRITHATGQGPDSTISADLNGDGRPDLLITNSSSDTVSVLLNLGSGAFARTDYGPYAQGLAVKDLNGDFRPDLAWTFYSAEAGRVFLRTMLNQGNGTYVMKADIPLGLYGGTVIPADFDGDGNIDLAVNDHSSPLMVMLGNGDGTFSNRLDYQMRTWGLRVFADDVNGDGRVDIVVVNDSVDVLLNIAKPAKLAVSQQPATATAGAAFTVKVEIRDANGHIMRTSSAAVTVSIESGPAGATLGGSSTVAAVNGVATFSTLTLSNAGTYVLRATSGALQGAITADLSIIQPPRPPATPALFAFINSTASSLAPILKVTSFSDPDGSAHSASQWTVTRVSDGVIVFDSGADTVNLGKFTIPLGILANSTTYLARVRFRDDSGLWSAYSPARTFTTAAPALPKGYIEQATWQAIVGFAYDSDRGAFPARARIDIDNVAGVPFHADVIREEMEQWRDIGTPAHGFRFVPPPLSTGFHKVTLYVQNAPGTAWVEVMATGMPEYKQPPIGGLDGVTRQRIAGWGFDWDARETPVMVRVDIDGVPGTPFLANAVRKDLAETLVGENHGFNFTPPALSAGAHTITLHVQNVPGTSYVKVATATIPAAVPGVPAQLAATALSENSIRVSWKLADAFATGIMVKRWDGASWPTIATLPAGATTYTDTSGLIPGTTYHYHVLAFNGAGMTWAAQYATGKTMGTAPAPPGIPTDLAAVALTWESVRFNWKLAGGETGVVVKRWDGSTWLTVATLPAGSTTFTETGLGPNRSYYYDVVAINGIGATWAAAYVTAKTFAAAPPPPATEFAFAKVSATSGRISWKLAGNDTAVYVAKWSGLHWQTIALLPGGSTSFVDPGLWIGAKFHYMVITANPFGQTWAASYVTSVMV